MPFSVDLGYCSLAVWNLVFLMLSHSPVVTHSLTAPTVQRMEGRLEQKVLPCSPGVCTFSIPKDGGYEQDPLSSSWVKLGDPREGKTRSKDFITASVYFIGH